MSSIRRTAFGLCLYCTYFTSKMNQQLSDIGARVPCPEKIFQGPLRKPRHTDTFQELLIDILLPEKHLEPKALAKGFPLQPSAGNLRSQGTNRVFFLRMWLYISGTKWAHSTLTWWAWLHSPRAKITCKPSNELGCFLNWPLRNGMRAWGCAQ